MFAYKHIPTDKYCKFASYGTGKLYDEPYRATLYVSKNIAMRAGKTKADDGVWTGDSTCVPWTDFEIVEIQFTWKEV